MRVLTVSCSEISSKICRLWLLCDMSHRFLPDYVK
jgi:hypothetical protein